MTELCSGCRRPQAHTFVEYREGNMCGIELPRTECNDTDMLLLNCAEAEIDRLRSEVATLKLREADALALADEMRASERRIFEQCSERVLKLETENAGLRKVVEAARQLRRWKPGVTRLAARLAFDAALAKLDGK